jgi:hypothetical protein
MPSAMSWPPPLRSSLILVLAVVLTGSMRGAALSQQASQLVITSPTSGVIVAPGARLHVSVQAIPIADFAGVFVVAESIGVSNRLESPPFEFDLDIPSRGVTGKIAVTAGGVTSDGRSVISSPVFLQVQPDEAAQAIAVEPNRIRLTFSGEEIYLRVIVTLASGVKVNATESALVRYVSRNPGVASVDGTGAVRAVAPGGTTILVVTGDREVVVPVSVVGGTVTGDINGDGVVDADDVGYLLDALGTHVMSNDSRDLNGDRIIDEDDAVKLLSLCAREKCATGGESLANVTWSRPVNTVAGIGLDGKQLNAMANVPGAFMYTPPAGTILGLGGHTLFAKFYPDDSRAFSVSVATTTITVVTPEDVNRDGRVDCADVLILRNTFGRRAGQAGFDPRADVNSDRLVDVRDLALVSQRLPIGTKCP